MKIVKFKKMILIFAIFVLGISIYNLVYVNPLVYNNNYWEDIGFNNIHLYNDVVEKFGKPDSITKDDITATVNYKDFKILYITNTEDEIVGEFKSVKVTGERYKFGIRSARVGSTREEVESAYGKYIKKIKDLPERMIGFIDGGVWIRYQLDENDIVSEVILSNGA